MQVLHVIRHKSCFQNCAVLANHVKLSKRYLNTRLPEIFTDCRRKCISTRLVFLLIIMKRSQREKERQTGRQRQTKQQRQTQTAEVQKQRHKDKGKQGVYEDWVHISSLNAFCYFHAIDANAMIVFFRIMFQPRYCRWISDRRGMWESTHMCITFKRNQPSHTVCLANRRVQNINTKSSIMLSVYELFLPKKFRSTGRIFKTLFWYYSQFLIFVALVTDSGTGCIQQRQVFYV